MYWVKRSSCIILNTAGVKGKTRLGKKRATFFHVVILKLKLSFQNTQKCVKGKGFACFLRQRKQNRGEKKEKPHVFFYCRLFTDLCYGHFEMM